MTNQIFENYSRQTLTPKQYVQSLDMVRSKLKRLNTDLHKTWRDIAKIPEFSGVPAGTLCAISKGRDPKKTHIRAILHLPVLAQAPVCVKCGNVHVSKRCTAGRPKPRAPKIAIRLDNIESAARTIVKHMSAEDRVKLIELILNGNDH